MHKYQLGNKSESMVLSTYLDAGFTVSIPFGTGASYDLVVDAGGTRRVTSLMPRWSIES